MTVPPEQSLSRSLPYATAVQRSDPAPHSRMGVASFAIGVVVVVGNIVLVVLAAASVSGSSAWTWAGVDTARIELIRRF